MRHSHFALALLTSAACLVPTMASAQGAGDTTSDEIVVTAQRRTERYVDVPATVSVVTAEQLNASGITNSHDLRLLTPGLNITQQGLYTQPTIRGVGTTVTGPGADPNVAIYVDGVYQPNQGAALFDFANVDRIETLKGPQGTLYGRNATGGALVITTRAPSLTDAGGSVELGYGSFNETTLRGYYNLPLGESVAVNLAVYDRRNDGYTDNVTRNENASVTEATNYRARVLIEPTDGVRFLFTGSRTQSFDSTAFSYSVLNNNGIGGGATLSAQFGANDHSHVALNTAPYAKVDAWGFSLNGEFSGDWGTLTSISSWSQVETPFSTDLDGTENNVQSFLSSPQFAETTSQEFIYASPTTGAFSWIGGVYYLKDDATSDVQVCLGALCPAAPPFAPYASQHTEAWSVYAEGTLDLTEALHLTAGGRYSEEDKHATNNNGSPSGLLMLSANGTWDSFTPHVALRYDLSENSSTYVSYSEGFKSGLFDAGNTGLCTQPPFQAPAAPGACPSAGSPVAPESVQAYEVGYKYNANGTNVSLSAYFNQYEDIQINALNALNQQVLYNAGAGEIYGAEAEFATNLTDNLSLRTGLAYTHSEYTDFDLGQNFVPRLPGPLCAGSNPNCQVSGNDAGNQMIRSPEWTAFGALTYTQPIGSGSLESTLTASYSDSYFWHVDNRLQQPAFTIVNGSVTWNAPGDTWHVRVFGDNLTDEETMLYVREATVGDFASWGRPRSWGIAVGANF